VAVFEKQSENKAHLFEAERVSESDVFIDVLCPVTPVGQGGHRVFHEIVNLEGQEKASAR